MRMSAKKNSKVPSTMNCKHEPGKELKASSEVVLTNTLNDTGTHIRLILVDGSLST
jgi:hypothetical protein